MSTIASGKRQILEMTRAQAGEVAVVTVNWNGWRLTLECLAALRRSRGVAWRLIIVDNASTDESVEALSALGDDVILIKAPSNGGWTGGNNLGVAHALELGFEHILLLNNDANVEPDTLSAFLRAQAEPAAQGAILGGVLSGVGDLSEAQGGNTVNPRTGLRDWLTLGETERGAHGPLRPTVSVCGAALFAHRSVYEDVGEFDDAFYLYFDETDWCARAVGKGHVCWIVENAVVGHVGLATTGGRDAPIFNYFMARNSLLFTERHATRGQWFQLLRILLGSLRLEARRLGPRPWPLALVRADDLVLRARRRGVLDYLTRRFGDCPASIRRLQEDWRQGGRAAGPRIETSLMPASEIFTSES